jgi:hypothetical protein
MDRRRKLLVNDYEKLADELLVKAVAPYGARVCPKVGLKDIVYISNSGISDEEFSYALKAHIDFCVVSRDNYIEFGLEIDERQHIEDTKTIAKDRLKNSLCAKLGFPLIRISEKSLARVDKLELLAWLASYYFAFSNLSKSKIDLRNPMIQKEFFLLNKEPFVYSPFADSYEFIRDIDKKGLFDKRANNEIPLCIHHNSLTYFISYAGVVLQSPHIAIENKPFLYSKMAFRAFNNFAGIYPFVISEGLAVVELDRKLREYLKGDYIPPKDETLDAIGKDIHKEYLKAQKLKESLK